MVTINSTQERTSEAGNVFTVVKVSNKGITAVCGKNGNWRFDSASAYVCSNLSEGHFKELIGKDIPGQVYQKSCDEYSFETSDGETITLNWCWAFTGSEEPQKDAYKG